MDRKKCSSSPNRKKVRIYLPIIRYGARTWLLRNSLLLAGPDVHFPIPPPITRPPSFAAIFHRCSAQLLKFSHATASMGDVASYLGDNPRRHLLLCAVRRRTSGVGQKVRCGFGQDGSGRNDAFCGPRPVLAAPWQVWPTSLSLGQLSWQSTGAGCDVGDWFAQHDDPHVDPVS